LVFYQTSYRFLAAFFSFITWAVIRTLKTRLQNIVMFPPQRIWGFPKTIDYNEIYM
jgi:hypothetical protein